MPVRTKVITSGVRQTKCEFLWIFIFYMHKKSRPLVLVHYYSCRIKQKSNWVHSESHWCFPCSGTDASWIDFRRSFPRDSSSWSPMTILWNFWNNRRKNRIGFWRRFGTLWLKLFWAFLWHRPPSMGEYFRLLRATFFCHWLIKSSLAIYFSYFVLVRFLIIII